MCGFYNSQRMPWTISSFMCHPPPFPFIPFAKRINILNFKTFFGNFVGQYSNNNREKNNITEIQFVDGFTNMTNHLRSFWPSRIFPKKGHFMTWQEAEGNGGGKGLSARLFVMIQSGHTKLCKIQESFGNPVSLPSPSSKRKIYNI